MNREKEVFDDLEGMVLEEARKIYSPTVIEHFLNPQNMGELPNADYVNAMSGICGDTVGIYVGIKDDKVERIGFVTNGCGPTIACSSAATSLAKGRSVQGALTITAKDVIEYLGGLPVEHTHCADLAVNTLRSVLAKSQ